MATTEAQQKEARDQLALVLSFFPRVDSKLSAVLAVNTAMLATLSTTFPAASKLSPLSITTSALTTLLLALSFFFLYRGGFPNTEGGGSSLTYFRSIAAKNESAYISAYAALTPEQLRSDLLAQVWRNSCILTSKYASLKKAFILMASALLPWAVTIALFAMAKQGLHVAVTR